MAATVDGPAEVWQARIARDLASQLRADAAALELLHRSAAEVCMA